jgi:hypothetical protein
MAERRDNYVYIAEADAEAVTRGVRRLQILVLTSIPVILIGVGMGVVLRALHGDSPLLTGPLGPILFLLAIPVVAAYCVVPRCIKKTDAWVGGDFIRAPLAASPRYTATAKYKDVTAVRVKVTKDRITGATIVAGRVVLCTGRIKDPGIVVRAIFERAPENIKWRPAWRPFRRLSREEVKELIEKAQVPDIDRLLPHSADYACLDDLYAHAQPEEPPGRTGLFGRLFGRGTYKGFDIISPQIPTPVNRYVNTMLLQMFENGPATRVIRQSEPLPVLTFRTETAEPPPLEDVLSHLKDKCRIKPKRHSDPVEGTIHIGIQGVPCKVLCRFDDGSDTCCELRLERMTEQELRAAEQKR